MVYSKDVSVDIRRFTHVTCCHVPLYYLFIYFFVLRVLACPGRTDDLPIRNCVFNHICIRYVLDFFLWILLHMSTKVSLSYMVYNKYTLKYQLSDEISIYKSVEQKVFLFYQPAFVCMNSIFVPEIGYVIYMQGICVNAHRGSFKYNLLNK